MLLARHHACRRPVVPRLLLHWLPQLYMALLPPRLFPHLMMPLTALMAALMAALLALLRDSVILLIIIHPRPPLWHCSKVLSCPVDLRISLQALRNIQATAPMLHCLVMPLLPRGLVACPRLMLLPPWGLMASTKLCLLTRSLTALPFLVLHS